MVLISGDASGLNKTLPNATKQLNLFQKAGTSAANALTGAFAAIGFASLGREVISITSEFQKFEAVLTNTLGSNSEAQKALEQIREFAAKTPFSVQELTQSFVKLANQGFEPTADEMRKLGDLASSTGKSFDQLTEAIIDAQTGEFERLKEFGIRASKAGDQVKFTFKGVQTQTDFTAESIREYLLGLGDLEGVSGSMAAISNTLGGSLSNLGDSFDNLLLTVGNLTSGPLKDFVDILQDSIKGLADDIAGRTGEISRLEAVNKLYVEGAKSVEDISKALEELTRLKKIEDQAYATATESLGDMNQQLTLSVEDYKKLASEQVTAKDFSDAYTAAIEALTAKLTKLNETQKVQLALIPAINAQIKHFEELKNQAFSEEEIGRFNEKLKELRDELEFLNATGSESAFLKNLNAGLPTGDVPQETSPQNIFPTEVPLDVSPFLEGIEAMDRASADFNVNEETRAKQQQARFDALIAKQMEAADAAATYGDAIGAALGDALSGQITFAQAMKRLTADLVKMFLQRALAGIISSAATSGGPPPVAIALAAAGVAAISAMFNKIGATTGGGGAPGIASQARNTGRATASATEAQDVKVTGQIVARGQDLWVILNNYEQNNKFTRANG